MNKLAQIPKFKTVAEEKAFAKKPSTQIPMHAPKMAFKKICKASSKRIKHKSTK